MPSTFATLGPTLIRTFVIIGGGYAAKRFQILDSAASSGVGKLISFIFLPALLFRNTAKLDLQDVNWRFIACIAAVKLVVFFIVAALTFVIARKKPNRWSKAGIRAIFATQSNDLALGLPFLRGVFASIDPAVVSSIYIIATTSLLITNPIVRLKHAALRLKS